MVAFAGCGMLDSMGGGNNSSSLTSCRLNASISSALVSMIFLERRSFTRATVDEGMRNTSLPVWMISLKLGGVDFMGEYVISIVLLLYTSVTDRSGTWNCPLGFKACSGGVTGGWGTLAVGAFCEMEYDNRSFRGKLDPFEGVALAPSRL